MVKVRTSDLQIEGIRCILYASQDGPIHLQSGCGFVRLYRRYRRYAVRSLYNTIFQNYGLQLCVKELFLTVRKHQHNFYLEPL